MSTLARLQRLLVMVPWLLEHPGVDVEEVAERFGVTVHQVADDIDVLGYCGLPGYGGGDLIEASISGGRVVVRMAEFFARPLRLTVREGLALLLAGRATRQSGLLGGSSDLDSAIDKLADLLGADAEHPVAVDLEAPGREHLDVLAQAIGAGRVVRLVYRSASKAQTTTRDVEPWAVRAADGAWYLHGWCRLADAPRDFRLDRIRAVTVTDLPTTHPRLDDPPAPAYEPDPDDPEVVLDVTEEGRWVMDAVVLDEATTLDDGRRRLRFRAASLDWAARLVLRLGPAAEVVTPADLTARVRQMATAVMARYDQEPAT